MKLTLPNYSNNLNLVQPGNVSYGVGVRWELKELLKPFNSRKVFIVTIRDCRQYAEAIEKSLQESGLETGLSDEVPPEPAISAFEKLREQFSQGQWDTVVGIGGGSVLDIAKLLAALGNSSSPLEDYIGKNLLPGRPLNLVCLPTTAGAGSEGSPNAILYNEKECIKQAVISPYLIPDITVIDPELTLSLPPHVTAATGFDALCHCIEAYANRHAHFIVDAYAIKGIQLISRYIETATKQGDNLEARCALAVGSFFGGLCLGPVNTAAVHALSYPLGSSFRMAHGLANALLMPHVLRYNISAMPDRYAEIAAAMGVSDEGSDQANANAGIEHLFKLCDACELERGLRRHGVSEDHLSELAEGAMKVTRLLNSNPREIDRKAAIDIYSQAL